MYGNEDLEIMEKVDRTHTKVRVRIDEVIPTKRIVFPRELPLCPNCGVRFRDTYYLCVHLQISDMCLDFWCGKYALVQFVNHLIFSQTMHVVSGRGKTKVRFGILALDYRSMQVVILDDFASREIAEHWSSPASYDRLPLLARAVAWRVAGGGESPDELLSLYRLS